MPGPWRPTPRETTGKEWGQWLFVPLAAEMEGWDISSILGFQVILLQVSDVGHRAARFTVLSSGFQP